MGVGEVGRSGDGFGWGEEGTAGFGLFGRPVIPFTSDKVMDVEMGGETYLSLRRATSPEET